MSYGSEAAKPEMPEMRPVVEIDRPKGDPRTVYALQPQQNKAYCLTPLERPPAMDYPRHIGYGGAAGGGKSYLARAVATAGCLKWPGINVLILRNTRDEVRQNHVNKFLEEVPRKLEAGQRLYSYNGEDMCATFENGSRIYFGFLRDSKDRERYSGNEYDIVIPEESTHYAWEDIRWLVGNRMRATQDYSRPFALYPSNPGRQGHQWYKRLFIDRNYEPSLNEDPSDYAFVQAKVEHNYILQRRDPEYVKMLDTLPEPLRSWLRDGDWEAGLGLALPMLQKSVHLVEPFQVPGHWTKFAAFDWGYAHPFSWGLYARNPDGRVFKMDTLTGRHLQPPQIANAIRSRLDSWGLEPDDLRYTVADKYAFDEQTALEDGTPTIAETFAQAGILLSRANQQRVHGLNHLRKYLSWKEMGPDGEDVTPMLVFFHTEGNKRCFDQLASIATDPDNPEDALKSDADKFGQGGDDHYDETRYAIASLPPPPRSRLSEDPVDAWSAETLEYEAEKKRRSRNPLEKEGAGRPAHPEFGTFY